MITVFDEAQRLHAPPGFIVSGKLQPSPERPERIDMLMEGVKRIGGPIVTPPPIDDETGSNWSTRRAISPSSRMCGRAGRGFPMPAPYPAPNIHALGRPTLRRSAIPIRVVGQCGYPSGRWLMPDHRRDLGLGPGECRDRPPMRRDLLLGGEHLVYALCRPPGHHAASDVAAGFCYFNNSALAAEILTRAGRRVAILDIDVHHGNGTEAIFYDRADVLTVSIHADPQALLSLLLGLCRRDGARRGRRLQSQSAVTARNGSIDRLSEGARTRHSSASRNSRPTLLVLAAGLDIAIDDPFKGFAIETTGFPTIGRAIAGLKLPMLVVQEGGYPSPSLGANLADSCGTA